MKHVLILTLSVTAALAAAPARAGLITFEFAGVIDTVFDPDNALEGAVQVGDPFSGSYTFDSNTPDSKPGDPQQGIYESPGPSMLLDISGIGVTVDQNNSSIVVLDNIAGDTYLVGALLPFDAGNLRILELSVWLNDPTETSLDSDALPLTPPDLTDFATRSLWVDGEKTGVGDFGITGELTSLIPEPGTMSLIVIGGVLLTTQRRKIRRYHR